MEAHHALLYKLCKTDAEGYRNFFFYELKYAFITHLSFLFTKQTSSAIVCSDWPFTVQVTSRFPAQNRTCFIQCRFLAPEKSGVRNVQHTDQFLVPVDWYQKLALETGQCVITINCQIWCLRMQNCLNLRSKLIIYNALFATNAEHI